MVCLIAVKDCPRTQRALKARFASEDTQPLSGGGGRSSRHCGHRTGRGAVIHMVGGARRVLAGGFVCNEAERLLLCERLDPVRHDWDLLRACQGHFPLAKASRPNDSFVSGSGLDLCGLNGSRSPTRVSVPDLGLRFELPNLEVQQARGNTEFASSICNELLRLLGRDLPPQDVGDKAHYANGSLHEIVVPRVHQQHSNCSVSDSVEWTQDTLDLVRMT